MDDQKNINNNGGYSPEDVIWHQHSNKLIIKILELWPDKERKIIDIGCGHNWYINTLNLLGYNGFGVDRIAFPDVQLLDVTQPLSLNIKPANVISLEVGEHIPLEKSEGYLENLTRFGGDIIMSWAIPGQAGIGHINCQTIFWVAEEMLKRNYTLDVEKTAALREAVNGCHCSWFKNTLMYFTPCE